MSFRHRNTNLPLGHLQECALGHFVESASVERSTGRGFMDATPLLEEESDFLPSAQFEDAIYPFLLHRTGSVSTLTAYDSPIDPRDIKSPEILKQGFYRKKLNRRTRRA